MLTNNNFVVSSPLLSSLHLCLDPQGTGSRLQPASSIWFKWSRSQWKATLRTPHKSIVWTWARKTTGTEMLNTQFVNVAFIPDVKLTKTSTKWIDTKTKFHWFIDTFHGSGSLSQTAIPDYASQTSSLIYVNISSTYFNIFARKMCT